MSKIFWRVYSNDDDITLFIQPAGSLAFARLNAAIAGMHGEYREGYELDHKIARQVPKTLIEKPLNRKEAAALLKKLR